MVECEDGYNRVGNNQHNCDLDGMGGVTWIFNDNRVNCLPGKITYSAISIIYVMLSMYVTVPCSNLTDPGNGKVTCPSTTGVFQDTCTYYCNRGYQLNGNPQPSCTVNGTWSSEPVTCAILMCNDPAVEISNSQSVDVCNMTYGSRCLLNCSNGFTVSGDGEYMCDDVNGVATWISIGKEFSCINGELQNT